MNELIVLLVGISIFLCVTFILSRFDFFSPSFIVCALFFISTLFAIYAVVSWGVDESIFTYEATYIILSGILVFIVGEQFARKLTVHKNKNAVASKNAKVIKVSNWKLMTVIFVCVGSMALYIFYLYEYVKINGYNGDFSPSQIASFYHKMSFMNETKGGMPRIVRFLSELTNAIMYVCMYIFLNNIILCRDKINNNIVFLIPILCWFPRVLFTSSRTNYLRLAGFAVLISYIMINRRTNWKRKKRNFKKMFKISFLSLISVLLLFYMAVASGLIGRQADKSLLDYIAVYVGAPIIHFNQFIIDPPTDVIYFGQETFAGLKSMLMKLGLRDSTYSTQLETRTIVGEYRGNVYTFFRRPLHDFGLFGMYVITVLTAFIYSYVYYKYIFNSAQSYKTDRIVIIYGFLFYVIYMFSIMNNYCNFVSMSLVYFLLSVWLTYVFLLGKVVFGNHK